MTALTVPKGIKVEYVPLELFPDIEPKSPLDAYYFEKELKTEINTSLHKYLYRYG